MYEKLLTESQQDYLKIIHTLIEKNRVARVKEIAEAKGVSMPTVTEAMKKLAQEDWISYQSRGFIELTEKGQKAAWYFAKRSEFLLNFLQDVLGTDNETAINEACTLEHHLSEQSLKRLGLLYQFLNHCPKTEINLLEMFNKCIQSNEGEKPEYFCIADNYPHSYKDHKHILLKNLSPGQRAKIMLLSADKEVRNFFLNKGLLPGIEISMKRADDKNFIIKHKDEAIKVPKNYGISVEVSILK